MRDATVPSTKPKAINKMQTTVATIAITLLRPVGRSDVRLGFSWIGLLILVLETRALMLVLDTLALSGRWVVLFERSLSKLERADASSPPSLSVVSPREGVSLNRNSWRVSAIEGWGEKSAERVLSPKLAIVPGAALKKSFSTAADAL